ncbi:MAG: acyl-CoA dehydrogenase family protein [Bacillota bacterium]
MFTLPREIEDLRLEVREFAQNKLKPLVRELDQAPADDFNWEIVREGAKIGLHRLPIPKEYGGLGYGLLGTSVAMEELSAVCAGTALIFGATMLGQAPILLSADRELQNRFLPMFSSDEPVLASNAITEPDAGCDLLIPENAKYAMNVLSARKDGNEYVINGTKKFITNARVAKFACVYANLEGFEGAQGLTCFVVPLDSEGIIFNGIADKMGYRACLGTEIVFNNVRVPIENIVGGEGNGMLISIQQMNMARGTVAAISTGVARGAFELTKEWAGERVQGGKVLYQHQFTARKLAEMAMKVESSRLLYLKASYEADNSLPAPTFEPAIAKLYADRIAIEVAEEAMSVMGARGYIRDHHLEKYMREALGARIYEGTPEVLALAITDYLYQENMVEEEVW